MKLTILICLALIATTALCGNSLSKFEGRPFQRKPPTGMYLLDGLGLDGLKNGQQIAAYGDVDNDKYTDIMTLDDEQTTLTVSLYVHVNFTFVPNVTITPGDKIVGVTTGDFNFDGKLDLLLTTSNTKTKQTQVQYFFRADKAPYYGNGASTPTHVLALADEAHPFVIDSNGNRHLDVVYVDANNERLMQTYENGGWKSHSFKDVVSAVGDGCLDYTQVANNKFATPHFNSFADLNGDCAADLLIFSVKGEEVFMEVYLRNPKGLFCLVDLVNVNENVTSISLADMSNDGKLDLIFVSEHTDAPLSINVIYNRFASNPLKPCTAVNDSMTNPFDKSAFEAIVTNAGINQITTLPSTYPVGTKLFTIDETHRPGRVRVGDINIDGYPDLVFIVKTPTPEGETRDESYGTIVLAFNQENTLVFNSGANSGLKSESLFYYNVMREENSQDAQNVNLLTVQATSASFFDFHEKGKLGLWINTKTKDTKTTLLGAFNFVTSENFILKALGLNGAKPASTSKGDINEVLGGLYYGASIECTVTKVDGKTVLSKAAQLPQSAYTSLDIPYMFLGLGRTNNYIEDFYMGISRKDDDAKGLQKQNWPTIIPNSQLIVNPRVATTWTLDIYVNPTSEAFLISLVTGIILLILGIIIIYLHRQEKAEDIANQDRMIHIFG